MAFRRIEIAALLVSQGTLGGLIGNGLLTLGNLFHLLRLERFVIHPNCLTHPSDKSMQLSDLWTGFVKNAIVQFVYLRKIIKVDFNYLRLRLGLSLFRTIAHRTEARFGFSWRRGFHHHRLSCWRWRSEELGFGILLVLRLLRLLRGVEDFFESSLCSRSV